MMRNKKTEREREKEETFITNALRNIYQHDNKDNVIFVTFNVSIYKMHKSIYFGT